MYTVQNHFFAQSLSDAAAMLAKSRRNVILGGGMWLRMTDRQLHTVIDLSKLGLDRIEDRKDEIAIGSMVTLRQLETEPCLQELFGGVLSRCVSSIVGVQFRNTATIGASVYAKFGFSDIITALLALDTRVELYHAGTMKLADFLAGPLPERDILRSIHIRKDGRCAAYETHRASATDFGILNVCAAKKPDGTYTVSVGGRPGVAVRCEEAAAALARGDIDAACAAIAETVHYGDNLRGSAEYRKALSGVLLQRAWNTLQEV